MALQAGRVGVHPSQVDLLGKIKKNVITDVLFNLLPWIRKTKWYYIKIASDGTNYSIVKSTLEGCDVVTGLLRLPLNYFVVDSKIVSCNLLPVKSVAKGLRTSSSGQFGVTIPSVSDFTEMELYVCCYKVTNTPALLSDTPVQSVRKVAKASKVDEPVEETTEPIEEPINTDTE